MSANQPPLTLLVGDCREVLATLPDESVQCCVTSPPYWGLRDYGHAGQIGQEATPEEFVQTMVEVFREVRRVLKNDGTCWINLGDSYNAYNANRGASTGFSDGKSGRDHPNHKRGLSTASLKNKDLVGIPWRVALALQADGWYLRQDIIWHKPNPMPESVTDRCTKAHEYIFLLTKSAKYFYDNEAIKDAVTSDRAPSRKAKKGGAGRAELRPAGTPYDGTGDTRNKRSVWTVPTKPYAEAHFATYPPDLIRPCILAGTRPAGKRCDCDQVISTPTGSVESNDPTLIVGRAGMSRPRGSSEGSRGITKRTQRHHAAQMKASEFRGEMEALCGPAFAHYIRTDISGARPLPPLILEEFLSRGWITMPEGDCGCPIFEADTVLDPFGGSGTTGQVALEHGRRAILIELNPQYAEIAEGRTSVTLGLGI